MAALGELQVATAALGAGSETGQPQVGRLCRQSRVDYVAARAKRAQKARQGDGAAPEVTRHGIDDGASCVEDRGRISVLRVQREQHSPVVSHPHPLRVDSGNACADGESSDRGPPREGIRGRLAAPGAGLKELKIGREGFDPGNAAAKDTWIVHGSRPNGAS